MGIKGRKAAKYEVRWILSVFAIAVYISAFLSIPLCPIRGCLSPDILIFQEWSSMRYRVQDLPRHQCWQKCTDPAFLEEKSAHQVHSPKSMIRDILPSTLFLSSKLSLSLSSPFHLFPLPQIFLPPFHHSLPHPLPPPRMSSRRLPRTKLHILILHLPLILRKRRKM
jgi:hypothetical protein